jgi:hypothetical protein
MKYLNINQVRLCVFGVKDKINNNDDYNNNNYNDKAVSCQNYNQDGRK